METVVMEIRAAEGGTDAALLVEKMYSAYVKKANRHGL